MKNKNKKTVQITRVGGETGEEEKKHDIQDFSKKQKAAGERRIR